MDKQLKVSCYYCGHKNDIDLSQYGVHSHIGLFDLCSNLDCQKVYAFDVEVVLKTVSYNAKWD